MEQAGIEGAVEEVETGNVSRTYRISGSSDYFLQLPGHEPSLRRGILGLKMQQDTDVPVPEILHYDLEEPFLVTGAVPGENIQGTESEQVYRQTGEIMASLHQQEHGYDRFGLLEVEGDDLVPSGIGSWRHGLDSLFNGYMGNAQKLLSLTDAGMLDHYFMRKREEVPDDREARLGHFDFHGDNVLQEGDEVTGVLDWDMIRVVDPALEVVKTERQFKRERKPYEAFRQGYEEERELEIDQELEEIYSMVSETSRLSELQYLKEAHGREPSQQDIDETMQEIDSITGMER